MESTTTRQKIEALSPAFAEVGSSYDVKKDFYLIYGIASEEPDAYLGMLYFKNGIRT